MKVQQQIRRRNRSTVGQSTTVLITMLAFFIILPIGLLGAEIARYFLCQQQLIACVQSAALTAACANASSNVQSFSATQAQSQYYALQIFQMNSLLNVSLSNAQLATSASQRPAANQALLYGQWVGKTFQLTGSFGYVPTFLSLSHIEGVFPITASANGGLPQLDFVLCFDISSSMDDYTIITLVNRYWNGTSVQYSIQSYSGSTGQGHLYDTVLSTTETGTPVNGMYPEVLDAYNSVTTDCAYQVQTSGRQAAGSSPTSYTSNKSGTFTDLVVNPDYTSTNNANSFSITTSTGTYTFPAGTAGVLTALESARGNLESAALATSAKVNFASLGSSSAICKTGWRVAYETYASDQNHAMPIGNAMQAAQNFFNIMNNDCDAHFSLVTFSNTVGTTSTQNLPIGSAYVDGGALYYESSYGEPAPLTDPMPASYNNPNPGIQLSLTSNNFDAVMMAVGGTSSTGTTGQPLCADGGTDIADSLTTALSWVTGGNHRPNAKQAIVLFTDGLPTAGGDSFPSYPNAQSAASSIGNQSIPLYCIGLAMPVRSGISTNLQQNQAGVLSDLAGRSSNGQFLQVTTADAPSLNVAFENVARSLVQLVL